MPFTMFTTSILLALVSTVGVAVSQNIDPESVPQDTRVFWCYQQITSCPLICLQLPGADGPPLANDCDPEVLGYNCVCSNGLSPNASEYTQTLPFFICNTINSNCVDNCVGDSACQGACWTDNPCGAQDPPRPNSTSLSTMSATASSTGGSDVVYTGLGDGSAQTGNPSAGAVPRRPPILEIGQGYSLGLLVVGFLAGFAILL